MPKVFVVKRGQRVQKFDTWKEAHRQAKHAPGSILRSFGSDIQAEEWIGQRLGKENISKTSYRSVSNGSSSSNSTTSTAGTSYSTLSPTKSDLGHPTRTSSTDSKDFPHPFLLRDLNLLKTESTSAPTPSAPPPPKKVTACPVLDPIPELSRQQRRILDEIISGKNYFFTGSAGCGKSVLIRAIIAEFKKRQALARTRTLRENSKGKEHGQVAERGPQLGKSSPIEEYRTWSLAVTASTGLSAVNIGGQTLHSWSGIHLGQWDAYIHLSIIRKSPASFNWLYTETLIIDEISMISGQMLDKLDYIGRHLRGNNKPFGGIQVILCGDFFQLPPVQKPEDPPVWFAFEAECWPRLIPNGHLAILTRVFRQKDPRFISVLEDIRQGITRQRNCFQVLSECVRTVIYQDGLEPTILYPRKVDVNALNSARLAAIELPTIRYEASDVPGLDQFGKKLSLKEATKLLNEDTRWPAVVDLKVGAMVMLVTNMGPGSPLCNGSIGVIVDFMTGSEATAQGVDIPSKAKNIASVGNNKWPVVEFVPSKYFGLEQYQRTWMPRMQVDILNQDDTVRASRNQVPLILAWALTIHKSMERDDCSHLTAGQGLTIERLKVDLQYVFSPGQAYVAISRATSLDTLQVLNFRYETADPDLTVLAWYAQLELDLVQESASEVCRDGNLENARNDTMQTGSGSSKDAVEDYDDASWDPTFSQAVFESVPP